MPLAEQLLMSTGEAVGEDGTVLTRGHRGMWSAEASGTDSSLAGVAGSGDQWVAVGEDGTIVFGRYGTWSTRASGTDKMLTGVASDASQWVAVGDDGTILTSPDGARWTTRASVTDKRLAGVASDGSQWVAVGQRAIVLTSPDGETWTPRNGQAYGTTIRRSSRRPTEFLRGVAGDGAQWLTVGDQGTIATSSDGVTWTRQGGVSRERLAGVTAGG